MHELEITPSQIARLVLGELVLGLYSWREIDSFCFTGYLKSEKCDLAYEEFLKSSAHLKELKGRIITRVDHKTLGDFLTEYSHINILSNGAIVYAFVC